MRCTDATPSGPRKKKASGVRAESGFPMLDISALSTQRVPSFFFWRELRAPEIVEKAMSHAKPT